MHQLLLVTAGLALAGTATATDYEPHSMTGSPALHEMIVSGRDRWAADGGLGVRTTAINPDSPWGVTDYGRVSVIRDAWGSGLGNGTDMNKVFAGTIDAVNAYYDAHPDADPQFVVIVTDWTVFTGGAFYMPIANDVSGIGYDGAGAGTEVFDTDPTSAAEGLVWLNGLDLYTGGQGAFYGGLLFGQEFGHRWLAFTQFRDAGGFTRSDLLGRDNAHWSFYLDTGWSWLEGNDWIDNQDGTFTTDHSTFDTVTHYSDLDLYLMGLVPAAQVPDMMLITSPTGGPSRAASPSAWAGSPVTVAGTAEMVTAQMIIDEEGARAPDVSASQKAFELSVILLLRKNDRVNADRVAQLDATLDMFKALWETDVRDLATVDFAFSGTPHPAPEIQVAFPDGGQVGEKLVFDTTGSVDPQGGELTYQWDWGNEGTYSTQNALTEYAFPNAGTFTVQLRVVTDSGAEALASAQVTIDDGPQGCACSLGPTRRASGGAWILGACLLGLAVGTRVRRRYSTRMS